MHVCVSVCVHIRLINYINSCVQITEAYLEHNQTSTMKYFCENCFSQKCTIIDVRLDSKYAYEITVQIQY